MATPYQVSSYFSRLHRWVRGDWQLLPWLGRSVRNEEGGEDQNPLGDLPRWKIVDNLRREPFAGGYFDGPPAEYVHFRAGICPGGRYGGTLRRFHLLLTGADLAARGGADLQSGITHNYRRGRRGPSDAGAAPASAPTGPGTCASAAGTALWRMAVTRRGMLAWTTAAEAERRAETVCGPTTAGCGTTGGSRGLLRILFAVSAGAAAGLVWLAGSLFCLEYERPIRAKPRQSRQGNVLPTAPGGP